MRILFKIIKSTILTIIFALTLILIIGQFNVSLKTYTLTNGQQTIVIQEMSHIAEPDFYNNVNQNISKLKDRGYKHLFEGLYINNEKDLAKLNDYMGFNLGLGHSIGYASGLSLQNDNLIIEKDDIRADTDSKTIIKSFEDKQINNKDIEILDSIHNIENNKINEFFIKSLLRVGLRLHLIAGDKLIMLDGMKEIILEERNKVLINFIEKEEGNIVVTYGAAHIQEILEYLELNGYNIIRTQKNEVF